MTISHRNDTLFHLTQFLYALVFSIPIWVVYFQSKITISQLSFLVGIQYAAQLILELPTGAFADIFGRKISTMLGYFLWSVSSVIIIVASGFTQLLFAILLAGLAEALISGSLEALVYDSHKQDGSEAEFSKVNATNGLLFQIALAIGTAAGGLLYQYWHGLPYLAYAVACGLAGFLSFFFIEPKIDSEKFSAKAYLRQMKRGVQEIVKTRDIALISLFSILVAGITWSNNLYFFDFMLVELRFPDVQRGFIAAGIRIFNVTVLRYLLQNKHIFTKKRSIYFFPLMMTICFLPGIWLRDWWSIIFVAGAVMAGTARFIILAQYLNDVFESKYRATAISAISMGVGIVFVFITWISGPLIQAYGVRFMYSVLGVLSVVLVLPLSFLVVQSFERSSHVHLKS